MNGNWPEGDEGKHLHALRCREDRCCFGCDCPCHLGVDMSLPEKPVPPSPARVLAGVLLTALDEEHIDSGCAGTSHGDLISELCSRLARRIRRGLASLRTCENGCGCRYGTDDPDSRECACDGPCTTLSSEAWQEPDPLW